MDGIRSCIQERSYRLRPFWFIQDEFGRVYFSPTISSTLSNDDRVVSRQYVPSTLTMAYQIPWSTVLCYSASFGASNGFRCPVCPSHLSITTECLGVSQRSLDLSPRDHVMLWAACSLWSSPWILCSILVPNIKVSDFQADSLVNPTYFKFHSKCSKTDPFRVGCDVYLGQGIIAAYSAVAWGNLLSPRRSVSGPLLTFGNGRPLTWQQLSFTALAVHLTLSRFLWLLFRSSLPDWGSVYCSSSSKPQSATSPQQDFGVNDLVLLTSSTSILQSVWSFTFPTGTYCTYGTFGAYLEIDASGWPS